MRKTLATCEELVTLLENSGLVETDEIAVLKNRAGKMQQDARTLVADLIERRYHTRYQADHLLAGRAGGFF